MFRYRYRLYNSTPRTWLTFDRNYAGARYTGQRGTLLKTSRKKRVQTRTPRFSPFFLLCISRSRFYIYSSQRNKAGRHFYQRLRNPNWNLPRTADFLGFFCTVERGREGGRKREGRREAGDYFAGKRKSESRGKRYGSTEFVTGVTKFPLCGAKFVIGFDCTYIGSLPARRTQPAFLPTACYC